MNHGLDCRCEGCRRLDRIGQHIYGPIPVACSRCGGRGRVPVPPKGESPFQQEYQNEIPCPACQYCVCDHHLAAHKGTRCDPDLKNDCLCRGFVAQGSVEGQHRKMIEDMTRGMAVPERYLVVESTLSTRDSLFRQFADRRREFTPKPPEEIDP